MSEVMVSPLISKKCIQKYFETALDYQNTKLDFKITIL